MGEPVTNAACEPVAEELASAAVMNVAVKQRDDSVTTVHEGEWLACLWVFGLWWNGTMLGVDDRRPFLQEWSGVMMGALLDSHGWCLHVLWPDCHGLRLPLR